MRRKAYIDPSIRLLTVRKLFVTSYESSEINDPTQMPGFLNCLLQSRYLSLSEIRISKFNGKLAIYKSQTEFCNFQSLVSIDYVS